tara:strand:- start:2328 stop:3359 length:1032 start_codon:yes stop_codon:yes gene_type:complete
MGTDTRTDGERAKEELGKLDPTNPADQEKIIALVAPFNPEKAMEMQRQFKAENLAKTKASEQQAYDRGRNTKADALAERRQAYTESGKGSSFKPEEAKTIERWDEDLGANVIDFYYPSKPNEVIKTTLAGKDVGQVSATNAKIYKEIGESKRASQLTAIKANKTADKLLKAIPAAGLEGDFDVYLSNILGAQGEKEEARTMITNLINGNAIQNLPKGPASDKDIALVMKGEPPANANAEYLASYARGIAKMAQAEARYFSDQERWMDGNDGLHGFGTYQNIQMAEETLSGMNPEALKMMENAYGRADEAAVVAGFEREYGFNLKEIKRALELDRQTLEKYRGI